MEWTGETLAKDLAKTKEQQVWMTWVQIPLGSIVLSSHTARADVLAVRKSFTNPCFTIYEVKVSRSDFGNDVNKGKYRLYFDYCSQLYFAAPSGIIHKEEVPEGCGLIVRGDNGWHSVKSAPRREYTPGVEMLLKLLMRGYEDHLVRWEQYDHLKNLEYKGLKEAGLRYGIKVAKDLANADSLVREAEALREKIGEVLGKDGYRTLGDAVFHLKADVESLFLRKKYAKETIQLVSIVDRLFQGTRFFADATPKQLRAIADRLEVIFQAEEKK